MEDEILRKQIQNSSDEIKILLEDGSWQKITELIAKESGLPASQKVILENEALMVLIGMDLQERLAPNLINQGFEKNLSQSISDKLKNRLFSRIQQYLPNKMEGNTLEIRPPALPMVEPGEVAHDVEPLKNIAEEKLAEVTMSIPSPKYPGGIDPYREPTK